MGFKKSRKFWSVLTGLLLVVGTVSVLAWHNLLREVPTYYESDVEHFKYGSVGVEAANGVPYWIWFVLQRPYDGTIGNADIVPLWNWAPREEFGLHWDGLNTSVREVFLNSAIGNGASNKTIDIESLERIQKWIMHLPSPKYPSSYPVDQQLASRGGEIFGQHCASCHKFGSDKIGTPIPIGWLGTDRHRLDSWTQEAKKAFNNLDEFDWRYEHFRKTIGYVAVPLDGIWLRAPYLHNGSVPTLKDLLTEPEHRPKTFYRGYDVYDPVEVGFVSKGEEAARVGMMFDTRLPGNSNQGHIYGTALPEGDKRALIEFLKSL